jgi:hypothetical protein
MVAICFFKKGVRPAWEDQINHFGGDFSAIVKIKTRESLKEKWDQFVKRLIGSYYEYSDNVFDWTNEIDYGNKDS